LCQDCWSSRICTKCFLNTPNPGKAWCHDCWNSNGKCIKCKTNAPNPGHKWCQNCFTAKNAKVCSKCKTHPPNNGYALCRNCWNPTGLSLVPTKTMTSNKYPNIEKQFHDGMAKKLYKGTIIEILSVYDKNRFTDYEKYKSTVAKANNNQANEKRWWHGSNLNCSLWTSQKICGGSCHICNILSKGFMMKYANSKNAWGRFGAGLYFAPDAAKSSDYTQPFQNVRCLILCKVVVGNAKICYKDEPTLKAPPSGYHSVLGKPGSGGSLNFPELVVFNEDAILPAYAVFYKI